MTCSVNDKAAGVRVIRTRKWESEIVGRASAPWSARSLPAIAERPQVVATEGPRGPGSRQRTPLRNARCMRTRSGHVDVACVREDPPSHKATADRLQTVQRCLPGQRPVIHSSRVARTAHGQDHSGRTSRFTGRRELPVTGGVPHQNRQGRNPQTEPTAK
jgi:hypothetical protein